MSSRNKAQMIKFTSLRHVPKWYAQAILRSDTAVSKPVLVFFASHRILD